MTGHPVSGTDRPAQCPQTRVSLIFDAVVRGLRQACLECRRLTRATRGEEAYERKMTAVVVRIASLLDGDQSDRDRRAWSTVAMMVGSIVISRGMPEQSETRTAPLDSALSTASTLTEAGRR